MTANHLLMQMQADLGGFSVTKAGLAQSTALGVALMAQWGVGYGNVDKQLIVMEGETFLSKYTKEKRDSKYAEWKLAIMKSTDWVN